MFKEKKLWKIIIGIEAKPVATTVEDGTITNPPYIGASSIVEWKAKDKNATSILIVNVKNICLRRITHNTIFIKSGVW